jgi:hypothetical protein
MWYYIQNDEKRGSFSLEEMQSLADQGDITESTLVWKKGMKGWQPLVETELEDILPEDIPPPVPSELPPPFPTTYGKVREEKAGKISPSAQAPISQDDRIKLLYAAKARIWAHWLFWLFIPYIGGIISVTKIKAEGDEPRNQAIGLLMISIMMTILPQIFTNWWFSFLAFFNVIYGAYKTQELIEKARSQLNMKDPLQAERQLLKHF